MEINLNRTSGARFFQRKQSDNSAYGHRSFLLCHLRDCGRLLFHTFGMARKSHGEVDGEQATVPPYDFGRERFSPSNHSHGSLFQIKSVWISSFLKMFIQEAGYGGIGDKAVRPLYETMTFVGKTEILDWDLALA